MYTRGGDSVLGHTPTLLGFNMPELDRAGQLLTASFWVNFCEDRSKCGGMVYKDILEGWVHEACHFVTTAFMTPVPRFIKCSLKATQHHCETNINKWRMFWMMFQQDISNINLLATVLLAGNANFLNTTTMDGLSYWPQKLSYASLMAASGSILVGLAVQNPRIFASKGWLGGLVVRHPSASGKTQVQSLVWPVFSVQNMVLVLGFPFELFLYSIILFIAALIVHLAIHSAKVQIYAAVTIMGLVIVSLFFYWLITEPLDGWQFSPQKCKTQRVEGSLQTVEGSFDKVAGWVVQLLFDFLVWLEPYMHYLALAKQLELGPPNLDCG
ncbi:hypothetical protein EDD17DRAFT_1828179 [Pisolithus thermaeus]|nr:hypothetical protein EV401DRAFT_2110548 [Pisolithus croceorrhizus]KAI6160868.1 hypothetical protein EDD17DRAFT_1828179 [Pisolithus thermaeus]